MTKMAVPFPIVPKFVPVATPYCVAIACPATCGRTSMFGIAQPFAEQLGKQIQIFVRQPVAHESQHALVGGLQMTRHERERIVPRRRLKHAVGIAHHRAPKPLRAARVMMAKAALVAHPDFVDLLVLARHHAQDFPSAAALGAAARAQRRCCSPPRSDCRALGTFVISHGRARKRKSCVVSAPTGQMSVVLPEK